MFLVNSWGSRFSFFQLDIFKSHWHFFSSNLWSVFAEFLYKSSLYALVYSTSEPVSVFSTVDLITFLDPLSGFNY